MEVLEPLWAACSLLWCSHVEKLFPYLQLIFLLLQLVLIASCPFTVSSYKSVSIFFVTPFFRQ